jgi:hypothetical protein
MLISDANKFVFVHTPKCGGDSMTVALKPSAIDDGSDRGERKHWSVRRIRQEYFSSPDRSWSRYFRFGFVRNPWQQVHSDYWFCRNHPVPGPEVGSWRDKVIRCKQIDFSQFVVDMCGQHGRAGVGLFGHYLANNDGQKLTSKVYRHEDLSEAWPDICENIGLPLLDLPRVNVTPDKPDFREDYDDRSRFLVERRFADDIQRFNYEFGR